MLVFVLILASFASPPISIEMNREAVTVSNLPKGEVKEEEKRFPKVLL